jgi:hypothetical protein
MFCVTQGAKARSQLVDFHVIADKTFMLLVIINKSDF